MEVMLPPLEKDKFCTLCHSDFVLWHGSTNTVEVHEKGKRLAELVQNPNSRGQKKLIHFVCRL